MRRGVSSLGLALVIVSLVAAAPSPGPLPETWTVVRVLDGDTLDVRVVDDHIERVRLVGIDAPELGECWSEEATTALTVLASGALRLQPDVTDRDRYGRLLRYASDGSGHDLGAALVEHGHAIARSFPPDVARDLDYRSRQELARSEGRGLWAPDACGGGASGLPPDAIAITIQPDPPGDDTLTPNEEWVSFRNVSAAPIDLTAHMVRDESASHRYRFGDTRLGPGEAVTLRTGCGVDTVTDRHWCVTGSAVWNNTGDTVYLLDPWGTVIRWLAYGSSVVPTAAPRGTRDTGPTD